MDRKILQLINQDLPVTREPFLELAGSKELENLLIAKIKELKKKKVIMRYSTKLNQGKVGYTTNAMVVWKVPVKHADKYARVMIKYKEISHCYLRKKNKEFPYNLYTMIHCRSQAKLDRLVGEIIKKTKLKDYVILKTLKEFKKTKQIV